MITIASNQGGSWTQIEESERWYPDGWERTAPGLWEKRVGTRQALLWNLPDGWRVQGYDTAKKFPVQTRGGSPAEGTPALSATYDEAVAAAQTIVFDADISTFERYLQGWWA